MKKTFFFIDIHRKFKKGFVLCAGRNNKGRICVQHQGGGTKKLFLRVDRFRYLNKFGFVLRILTHSFFSGFIGLVLYDNGLLSFILLSEGVLKGYKIFSGKKKSKGFFRQYSKDFEYKAI